MHEHTVQVIREGVMAAISATHAKGKEIQMKYEPRLAVPFLANAHDGLGRARLHGLDLAKARQCVSLRVSVFILVFAVQHSAHLISWPVLLRQSRRLSIFRRRVINDDQTGRTQGTHFSPCLEMHAFVEQPGKKSNRSSFGYLTTCSSWQHSVSPAITKHDFVHL